MSAGSDINAALDKLVKDSKAAAANKNADFFKELYAAQMEIFGGEKAFSENADMIYGMYQNIDKAKSFACSAEFCEIKLDESNAVAFRFSQGKLSAWTGVENLADLKQVYAIQITGQKGATLDIGFNGDTRIVQFRERLNSSYIDSNIVGYLVKGKNKLYLTPGKMPSQEVEVIITAAKEGEEMDSDTGNVLKWKGIIDKLTELEFDAI